MRIKFIEINTFSMFGNTIKIHLKKIYIKFSINIVELVFVFIARFNAFRKLFK